MTEPETASAITITFDEERRAYEPGETLGGEYEISASLLQEAKVVEVSVLWSSEGKGGRDIAVHSFDRHSVSSGSWFTPGYPGHFHAILPNSPLSYDGRIVKIRWCVRVRVFRGWGRDVVHEVPFTLGAVPPPPADDDGSSQEPPEKPSEKPSEKLPEKSAEKPA